MPEGLQTGQLVRVRNRQFVVEQVVPPPTPADHTLVRLACLDDDAQGQRLEVLWEREIDARVLGEGGQALGELRGLDDPRRFSAYLHAIRWGCVTATDPNLFQAPFRAGIDIDGKIYQLEPLQKALALPRVNLFIADDVGLGKTIEAGLVLQELLLRQKVQRVVIVCPASIVLQWRDELAQRFGLTFAVYDRTFVRARRRERGFAVNPWTTHSRFIVSYSLLRRPEYGEPLLQALRSWMQAQEGRSHVPRSLLILDEAHNVAPASASKYAIDSDTTKIVRELAHCFEHRLFLSATPHNGHSESFSSLLELLDPQRFTRGVPVSGPEQLQPVMVRRLKRDLRGLPGVKVPRRRVIQIDLAWERGAWRMRETEEGATLHEADLPVDSILADSLPAELALAEKLAAYTELRKQELADAPRRRRAAAALVLVNLQKRLLSSTAAFARTLDLHAKAALREEPAATQAELPLPPLPPPPPPPPIDESDDPDDDEREERDAGRDAAASTAMGSADAKARVLLRVLVDLASRARTRKDARVVALIDWIRRNLCPGGRWNDRRVIVFTEYGDTKKYLRDALEAAFEDTPRGDERVLEFHGGMSDEQRADVQERWNTRPDRDPVRILLATDAAREGVNLQAYCADLFHFDVPWNPARMEQRNGRIDRTLQLSEDVRCHYFFFPQRREDQVLRALVRKVATIQDELGSLADVVQRRLETALEAGIAPDAEARIEAAARPTPREIEAVDELGHAAARDLELRVERLRGVLEESAKRMGFDARHLRDTTSVGLEIAGASPLAPDPESEPSLPSWILPRLDRSWDGVLDSLRPPRRRDEPPWEWRRRPPKPVTFAAAARLDARTVQLHLEQPLCQRILSRFRTQGFSAHDLHRATVIENPHDHLRRVIAFGRLALYGRGATRLHEELVWVAARWVEGEDGARLKPFGDEGDRTAIGRLEELLAGAPPLHPSERVRSLVLRHATADFAALWPYVEAYAGELEEAARKRLSARGQTESEQMRRILERQKELIEKRQREAEQRAFEFTDAEREQREQLEAHRRFWRRRFDEIPGEIAREPAAIAAGYEVVTHRIAPLGLVYLWPKTG